MSKFSSVFQYKFTGKYPIPVIEPYVSKVIELKSVTLQR